MLRIQGGLFPRREWALVLAVLERSVVFLTADTIESLIPQTNELGTAREVASIFLASIGAQCLDDEERHIVGYSVESTCYVKFWLSITPCSDDNGEEKTKAEEYERCKSR